MILSLILLDIFPIMLAFSKSRKQKTLSVVWMFHNGKLNNHINHVHRRALRIAYQDHNSTFNELLAKDGFFKIRDHSLQKLLIKIFKVKMKLAPEILNEVFDFMEFRYSLRNELRFKSRSLRIVRYWIETAAFGLVWTNMPNELNKNTSLNEFKSKLKTWKPENCPCKFCKIYLERIGYLQATD